MGQRPGELMFIVFCLMFIDFYWFLLTFINFIIDLIDFLMVFWPWGSKFETPLTDLAKNRLGQKPTEANGNERKPTTWCGKWVSGGGVGEGDRSLPTFSQPFDPIKGGRRIRFHF